jgi:hypothetical protein
MLSWSQVLHPPDGRALGTCKHRTLLISFISKHKKQQKHWHLCRFRIIYSQPLKFCRLPVTLLTVGCKVQVPLGYSLHGSISSCGKGTKKIEGGSSLAVGPHHSLWVWLPWLQCGSITIYVITPVAWEFHPIHILKVWWPGLCKLSCHSAKLFDRTQCHHQTPKQMLSH